MIVSNKVTLFNSYYDAAMMSKVHDNYQEL